MLLLRHSSKRHTHLMLYEAQEIRDLSIAQALLCAVLNQGGSKRLAEGFTHGRGMLGAGTTQKKC